jgi:trimethylamine--corrinoid protein Co-methyltransferase
MAKIVFGDEFVDQNCVLTSLINVNSPLVYDATMLGSLKVYAKNNQATVVSPFILSGAMSPVTVTGTVTQILAEAMAGIALTQLIRPGCPVIFGTFAAAVSMATGAPTFGTPEPSMVIYAAGALARRLGVPFRSGGGLCGSKLPDAQAAYEAANTLQTSALAGVNFMLHTAGWLEGGLAMGYEKFIMDCDQASMIAVLLGGMDMSENGQAMSAFEEVGPGKHFLGSEHTLANFETAFYRSTVADNNSYEQWSAEGRLDAAQRANALWKKMLAEYQAPELDPAIDEALQAFMTEQKASFADRDY